MQEWADFNGIMNPKVIGWDFPIVSQEQINVFGCMYFAGRFCTDGLEIVTQTVSKYAAITNKKPFANPFVVISDAYKTLIRYMEVNNISHREGCLILF